MFTRISLWAVSLAAVLGMAAAPSPAGTFIQLDDLNSQVRFTPDSGVIGWDIDGANQLKQQGFWYRLDGMTQTAPLMNLASGSGSFTYKPSDNDYDTGDETLHAVYDNGAGFSTTLTHTLAGGLAGSHTSSLQETIAFTNTTAQAIHLQFYQYCDFDLSGPTAGADTVQRVNANTIVQQGGATTVAETVVTPSPVLSEVATYGATLAKLNTTADNLDGSTGPLGPADVTWAFQWDLSVSAGQTVQISKIKSVLPEPATLALMGSGLLIAAAACRRRMR
jgi:hypothetical protein